jgi:serine/threonine protein phosphatase 1
MEPESYVGGPVLLTSAHAAYDGHMLEFASILNLWRPRRSESAQYPGLVEGRVAYVVGDIHGRLDCLIRAHDSIDHDRRQGSSSTLCSEIYLGDYIDRGPDSSGVIAHLIERRGQVDGVFLRGNHETLMEQFLDGQISFDRWRSVGGVETLLSYGYEAERLAPGQRLDPAFVAAQIPSEHRAFLRSLTSHHQVGPYCFVHAGLRPNIALENQSLHDLTWIRDEFLTHRGDFGFIVVHGHTAVAEVDCQPNRINIDTGAYLTNRLTVLRIDSNGPACLI